MAAIWSAYCSASTLRRPPASPPGRPGSRASRASGAWPPSARPRPGPGGAGAGPGGTRRRAGAPSLPVEQGHAGEHQLARSGPAPGERDGRPPARRRSGPPARCGRPGHPAPRTGAAGGGRTPRTPRPRVGVAWPRSPAGRGPGRSEGHRAGRRRHGRPGRSRGGCAASRAGPAPWACPHPSPRRTGHRRRTTSAPAHPTDRLGPVAPWRRAGRQVSGRRVGRSAAGRSAGQQDPAGQQVGRVGRVGGSAVRPLAPMSRGDGRPGQYSRCSWNPPSPAPCRTPGRPAPDDAFSRRRRLAHPAASGRRCTPRPGHCASWPGPGRARPGCSPSGWPAASGTARPTPTTPRCAPSPARRPTSSAGAFGSTACRCRRRPRRGRPGTRGPSRARSTSWR